MLDQCSCPKEMEPKKAGSEEQDSSSSNQDEIEIQESSQITNAGRLHGSSSFNNNICLQEAMSSNIDLMQEVLLHLELVDLYCLQAVSKGWKIAVETLPALLAKREFLLLLDLKEQAGQDCEVGIEVHPNIDFRVISRRFWRTRGVVVFGGDIICYQNLDGNLSVCNPKTRECLSFPAPEGQPCHLCFAFGFKHAENNEGDGVITIGTFGVDNSIVCFVQYIEFGLEHDMHIKSLWVPMVQHCPVPLKQHGLVLNEEIFWLTELNPRRIVVLKLFSETFHFMEGPADCNKSSSCSLAICRMRLLYTSSYGKVLTLWQRNELHWVKILQLNVEHDFKVLTGSSMSGFLLLECCASKSSKQFYVLDLDNRNISLVFDRAFPLTYTLGFCRQNFAFFVEWE